MIDENLVNFIRTQVQNGVARDLVVNALLQNNWRITDINNAYAMVDQSFVNKSPVIPVAPVQPREQVAVNNPVESVQKPKPQGSSVFMKIAVFIIILVFILGIGLFVYLKFFDGSISDILSNIPFVKDLIAPKTSDLIQ